MSGLLSAAPGDEIPDAAHVVHYVGGSKVDNGVVEGSVFIIKPGKDGLSVNWLEYFKDLEKEAQVDAVRKAIHLCLRPTAEFAELNIGRTKGHIGEVFPDLPARCIYAPSPADGKFDADPSHCDIVGLPPSEDADVAALVGEMISQCVLRTYPARREEKDNDP